MSFKSGSVRYKYMEFIQIRIEKIFDMTDTRNSTALRCVSFSGKSLKKSTCAVMIRIIITFGNQIIL